MTQEQFKRIWIPLNSGFYKVAYHFLESEEDAKDAVQDLYIRLWNSKDSLDSILNPQAYGLTLIRNICIDRIRKRNFHRNEKKPRESAAGLLSPPSDSRIIGREEITRLKNAMQHLPHMQKEVMEYRFFKDMDFNEIAEKTGLSNVNVRVMITRARATLKKLLKTELQ